MLQGARRPGAHRGRPARAARARRGSAFDRIVVETTGLADPAPILHALMTDREIADALRLESVIATVDCAAGDATLDAHPASVKQVALADRLILTKADLADPAASGLAERVRRINPSGAAARRAARRGRREPAFQLSVHRMTDRCTAAKPILTTA